MNILSVASQMFVHWPQQVMVALGCENKLYEVRRGQSVIPYLEIIKDVHGSFHAYGARL